MASNNNKIFITPDYMTKFKCIGKDCIDSCCAGWNIELDNGKTFKVRLEDGNFCKFVDTYGGAGCSYTSNGNKVFINDNNSVFILKGSRSYFSNKIKGTWKSNHTNNQGKFWGYEEKIK